MVWGCFASGGCGNLAEVHARITAEVYIEVLQDHLLPWIDANFPTGHVFQQENAPSHTAHATTAFLADSNVNVLPWPSRSPDLNPIENL